MYAVERDRTGQALVDALREVLDAALRRLSPKSDMAKAIAYGNNAGRRNAASW
jgi:hypothetical protein